MSFAASATLERPVAVRWLIALAPPLDQAAVEAVTRWRFDPARSGSDAVAVWVLIPVEFRIRSAFWAIIAGHARPRGRPRWPRGSREFPFVDSPEWLWDHNLPS